MTENKQLNVTAVAWQHLKLTFTLSTIWKSVICCKCNERWNKVDFSCASQYQLKPQTEISLCYTFLPICSVCGCFMLWTHTRYNWIHQIHPNSTTQDTSGTLEGPHQGIFGQVWKQSIWMCTNQTFKKMCRNLGGQQRRSLSSEKGNTIQHLHEEPDLWNSVLWTDESKVEMLDEN